jgi:rod shape determining protein RodA
MSQPQQNSSINQKGLDWILLSIFLALVIIGWMMVYSSNYDENNIYSFIDFSSEMGRQSLWVVIAIVLFVVTLAIEWNFWNTFAIPLYLISIVLLILVLFFGELVKGNRSWFDFGFVGFQPSEIAKFGTCLALSSYMSFNKNNLKDNKVLLTAMAIFLVPVFLILLQPDAGSALVFMSFFMLLYRKGLSSLLYVLAFILLMIFIFSLMFSPHSIFLFCLFVGFGIMLFNYQVTLPSIATFMLSIGASIVAFYYKVEPLIFIVPLIGFAIAAFLLFKERNIRVLSLVAIAVTFITVLSYGTDYLFEEVIKPHQQERINIWLRPERCDPQGPLYNLIQSKLAIGSGGFLGKGYLNGEMTKLNYVPEQSTDFIFSIVGEEQGFIGTTSVIILYLLLIVRSIIIAERAKLEFIRNYAYCIAGIFFVHFFVNIGMTMGLMPIIGIPLPLLSRGGTSLAIFSVMISVLIKMDASRFRT